MDLTTLARVKRFAGYTNPDAANDDDTLISQIITGVSRQIESYLDRYAEAVARTVYFDCENVQRHFYLKAFPVSAVTTFKNDILRTFAAGTELDTGVYAVYGSVGRITVDRYELQGGARAVQVVYTGGMAATVTALVADASYADLVLAATMQVHYTLKWRGKVGLSGISTQSGNAQFDKFRGQGEEVTDIIPEVKGLLERYRRVSFGEEEST